MKTRLLGLCAVAVSLALLPSDADADDDIEPCWTAGDEVDIPGFVAAESKFKPQPRYPKQALTQWSEGWALLEFAITAEGVPQGISVVDAMGPKDFVKESLRSVGNWRYKPATRNGRPVEQSLSQVSVLYKIWGGGRHAEHTPFVRKYNQARDFIRRNDYDGAISVLEQAFKLRLNLYEEAMGSFVLALAYTEKGDWARALYHARHAYIEDGEFLNDELKSPALTLLVELGTRAGAYNEVLCAFERLREIDPPAAAEGAPSAVTAARVDAALKSPAPLGTPARLAKHPLSDAPAVWRHRLLRSKFYFADVEGDVGTFRLACIGTAHEAPVDAETRWEVPTKAGKCILRVEGAPGASFTLVEEN